MGKKAHILAPALMALSMFFYVANDATVKFLGSTMPLGQIMSLRGVFIITLLLALVLLLPGHGPFSLRWLTQRAVVLRSALDTAVTLFYLFALLHMPIANILAIMNLSPLLILPLAAWWLGERLHTADMLAVLAGLAGALLVVRPGAEGFNAWALSALAAALAAAVRDVATRDIPSTAPTVVVVLGNVLMVQLAALCIWLLLETPHWPQPEEWRLLALAALLLAAAIAALVAAVRIAPLAVSAPWRYSVVVWGVLAGWLVFGEVPDLLTALGIVIILLASLHATFRQVRPSGA